ncbi:MAG: redoxin domain-containing protein [Oligoflexales bacterium]|nr:redoxin domain-containing protein [Oligoflexales bacterium]
MSEQKQHSPRSSKKHFIGIGILIAISISIISVAYKGLQIDTSHIPTVLLNKPALGFRVPVISGASNFNPQEVDFANLTDFKGKGLIINFWASWCVSCRQEAQNLEAFWRQHRAGSDVALIGIAIQDTKEDALNFVENYGKTYLIALDVDGRAALDYGVTGAPETFFIDGNGIIKHKITGPVDVALLEEFLPLITTTDAATVKSSL